MIMYTLTLNEDEAFEVKKLLTYGPTKYSSIPYAFEANTFAFKNKEDLETIKEATSSLASNIAQAVANNRVAGNNANVRKTPKELATDEIAQNIDDAMAKNPRMKTDMERAAKKLGMNEDVARATFNEALAETNSIAEALDQLKLIVSGSLFESEIDTITQEMMQYLVALKAKNIKSLSLSKFAKLIDKASIDIVASDDMEYFTSLVNGLPVVTEVDGDRIYLIDRGTGSSDEEEPEDEKTVDKTATDVAKKNITNDGSSKMAANNLFKENIEVATFEVAEKLADILANKGWAGKNDAILQKGADDIKTEYPDVDIHLLKKATVDFYNQYYAITESTGDEQIKIMHNESMTKETAHKRKPKEVVLQSMQELGYDVNDIVFDKELNCWKVS